MADIKIVIKKIERYSKSDEKKKYIQQIYYKKQVIKSMGNQQYQNSIRTKQLTDVYKIYSNELIIKKHLTQDKRKIPRNIINQLFQSFKNYQQYTWSNDIIKFFIDYFYDYLRNLWANDTILFYQQLLDQLGNCDNGSKLGQSYYIQNGENKKKQAEKQNVAKQIQNRFYQKYKVINIQQKQQKQKTQKQLFALNSSIVQEKDQLTLLNMNFGHHRKKQMTRKQQIKQIQRSSFISSQTVFTQRLDKEEKQKIRDILNFYKKFSITLQQILRSIKLISFPLKHFQMAFKKKIQCKKIKPHTISTLLRMNTKQALIYRKKQEHNNGYLLNQVKDFCQAYSQFIWKYLNLFRMSQTCFANHITIDTAYGVVLRTVWNFTIWIAERGFEWQQMQIPNAIKLLNDKQKQLQSRQKRKRPKKLQIKLDEQCIQLGCDLSRGNDPQKYLKQIVIIYRQLSKKCTCADELILYYEQLFEEIAKRDCYHRLFKMKLIIQKLLKIQDVYGEICYAWTTWNIMVENLKNVIQENCGEMVKEVQEQVLRQSQRK